MSARQALCRTATGASEPLPDRVHDFETAGPEAGRFDSVAWLCAYALTSTSVAQLWGTRFSTNRKPAIA